MNGSSARRRRRRRQRHRAAAAVLLLGLGLLLAGCIRVELNDLAIVTVIGLDRSDDGQALLHVQLARPTHLIGASGGGEGTPAAGTQGSTTLSAAGDTFTAAARTLQEGLSRQLFWAHARVMVLGEPLARAGVLPAVDFLLREPGFRVDALMAVSRGPAKPVLEAPATVYEAVPAEELREEIRQRLNLSVTIKDFAEALVEEGIDPAAPGIRLVQEEFGQAIHLDGAAVFHGGRLAGWLDDIQTQGLLWMKGEIETSRLLSTTAGMDGQKARIGLLVVRARSELLPGEGGDLLQVRLRVRGTDDILEINGSFDPTDPAALKRLNDAIAETVIRSAEEALERMQDLGADAAGIGRMIARVEPEAWARLRRDWEAHFRQVTLTPDIRFQVRRPGFILRPFQIPTTEGESP